MFKLPDWKLRSGWWLAVLLVTAASGGSKQIDMCGKHRESPKTSMKTRNEP